MFEKLKSLFAAPTRQHVRFDDDRIIRMLGDAEYESVRWDELRAIEIKTTNEGPFVDDVFWVLHAEEGGCVLPSETEGMDVLLSRLQQLPGFDDHAVIEAMGCTDNDQFPVWTCRSVDERA